MTATHHPRHLLERAIFLALLVAVAAPFTWMSPPVALALGVAFGMLAYRHPFAPEARMGAKVLLQVSVVALGFSMDLQQVLLAGKSGFLYTIVGIGFALGAGWLLGRLLSVESKAAYLISVGTAICGGSAIAAVGPVVEANDEEMSVSIGTVFLLNAAGLLLFPPLGHFFALTESQFGLWAALAIHDTSSVVGAGAKYGAIALVVATTVKLARALWIVPLTLATAAVMKRPRQGAGMKIAWPWFILLFLLAAVAKTYLPAAGTLYPKLALAGKVGLTITLFLIGTGMTRASLKRVGMRPLAMGIALWILVATLSLCLIRAGWISLNL